MSFRGESTPSQRRTRNSEKMYLRYKMTIRLVMYAYVCVCVLELQGRVDTITTENKKLRENVSTLQVDNKVGYVYIYMYVCVCVHMYVCSFMSLRRHGMFVFVSVCAYVLAERTRFSVICQTTNEHTHNTHMCACRGYAV
jgi:hypothetical protein